CNEQLGAENVHTNEISLLLILLGVPRSFSTVGGSRPIRLIGSTSASFSGFSGGFGVSRVTGFGFGTCTGADGGGVTGAAMTGGGGLASFANHPFIVVQPPSIRLATTIKPTTVAGRAVPAVAAMARCCGSEFRLVMRVSQVKVRNLS